MDTLTQLGLEIKNLAGASGWTELLKFILEIVVLVYAGTWIWSRIKGTQAERLVKGILMLLVVCWFSWLAHLTLIVFILKQLLPVVPLALLIVFQPEIRRGLGYLGRGQKFKLDLSLNKGQQDKSRLVIEQIISAVRELARTKTGALIVVEPPEGERDYLSPGVPINADVTSNLLLSIFFPNSPLHDGAAIIRGDKLIAAGVILPMTDNPKLSYRYGTRHRAAIGLSEIYDALCIVLSEETGHISAASRGMLVHYATADELSEPLASIYHQGIDAKSWGTLQSLLSFFGKANQLPADPTYGAPKFKPLPQTDYAPEYGLEGEEQLSEPIEPEPKQTR